MQHPMLQLPFADLRLLCCSCLVWCGLIWLFCLMCLIWRGLIWLRLWQGQVWLRVTWGLGLIWRVATLNMLTWRLHKTRAEVLYRALRPLLHQHGPCKVAALCKWNTFIQTVTRYFPCSCCLYSPRQYKRKLECRLCYDKQRCIQICQGSRF